MSYNSRGRGLFDGQAGAGYRSKVGGVDGWGEGEGGWSDGLAGEILTTKAWGGGGGLRGEFDGGGGGGVAG